jgi:hypothetical protein
VQRNEFLDNPQIRCLPAGVPRIYALTQPYKIVQTPDLVIMLYENGTLYRQIFLDGRPHPANPQPAWLGYSIGRWEGDTLVVETVGFNDQTWLDGTGHPHSDRMRLTERFARRTVGRMDLEITIDDPGAYTRPIRYLQPQELLPEGELIEYVCSENVKPLRRSLRSERAERPERSVGACAPRLAPRSPEQRLELVAEARRSSR